MKARNRLLVAGGLAGKVEFSAREPNHGVEIKQRLGELGDQSEPSVPSTDVGEFMGKNHPPFIRRAVGGPCRIRRKNEYNARVNRKPTLYLLCGLPGSGKTALAKRLERETPALRLTPDDWMIPLYGANICEPNTLDRWNDAHDRVEKVQWQIAERALLLGVNVVLDFGVWAREEREDFRTRAASIGARSELTYLDVPLGVLKERVKAPNEASGQGAYAISEGELEQWWAIFQRPSPDELDPRE